MGAVDDGASFFPSSPPLLLLISSASAVKSASQTIRDEVNFVWDNVSNGRYLRWSMDTFTGGAYFFRDGAQDGALDFSSSPPPTICLTPVCTIHRASGQRLDEIPLRH